VELAQLDPPQPGDGLDADLALQNPVELFLSRISAKVSGQNVLAKIL
jgi:hypothetical protein